MKQQTRQFRIIFIGSLTGICLDLGQGKNKFYCSGLILSSALSFSIFSANKDSLVLFHSYGYRPVT